MLLGSITLLVALSISAVAAFYSIIGLMAIFSAAALEIALMGAVLEVGKLVTASWLYQHWQSKLVPKLLKIYLTIAVVVLVFITSMGIFGFLSKAHIDQTILTGDNSLEISQIETRIERQEKRVIDAELVISQLDAQVQTLIDYDRIRGEDGAVATRENQKEERAELNKVIDDAMTVISELNVQKLALSKEQIQLDAEVGPLKYIAELVYGEENAKDHFDQAVRWVIIVFIFVFDPLAVLLLIAANITLKKTKIYKRRIRGPVTKRKTIAKVMKGREKSTLKEDTEDFGEVRRVTRTDGDVSSVHYE